MQNQNPVVHAFENPHPCPGRKGGPPAMPEPLRNSDLHLEFGSGWMLPAAVNGDGMILAGDIVKA
ncbi:MAG: hypothetical protein WCC37_12870 [Candidatus Sulfotelmatobacter sp.]